MAETKTKLKPLDSLEPEQRDANQPKIYAPSDSSHLPLMAETTIKPEALQSLEPEQSDAKNPKFCTRSDSSPPPLMAETTTKLEPLDSLEPEQRDAKKRKICTPSDSIHRVLKSERVVLNPADCNLDFNIDGNGLQGSALHKGGFAYCWSGARATVGINEGKYCFSCKIVSVQSVTMEDTNPEQQNICRVGISRGDCNPGELGETNNSFGFGGTGKFSNSGKFSDYGGKFGVGDTITCAVNLEDRPLASISFSKNGKSLGVAMKFDAGVKGLGIVSSPVKSLQWSSALFPHVLLKNVVVQLQFCIADGLVPMEGYKPWDMAFDNGNALMGPKFPDSGKCEILMMVGLPAAGKTTWAEKWVKEHPEKRYILLGTNLAIEQMKVPGLMRKHNYGERFDLLMDRATDIFNTLLSRACKASHNYIIDQTNVYKNARKRKLKPFSNFNKTAVVVFPKPDELKVRSVKRSKEMGKEVPVEAVNEMIANFIIPMSKDMPGNDEFFDKVLFTELPCIDAQKLLAEMKNALGSPAKQIPRCYNSAHQSRGTAVKSSPSNSSLSCGSGRFNQIRENSSPGEYGSPYVLSGRDMSHMSTLRSYNTAEYLDNSPSYMRDDSSTRYGMAGGIYAQRGPYGSPGIPSRSPIRGFSTHGTPNFDFSRNAGEHIGSFSYSRENSYETSLHSSAKSSSSLGRGNGYSNDQTISPQNLFSSPGFPNAANGSPYQASAPKDRFESHSNRSMPYGGAHFHPGPRYY